MSHCSEDGGYRNCLAMIFIYCQRETRGAGAAGADFVCALHHHNDKHRAVQRGTTSFNDQMSSARMLSRLWHRALVQISGEIHRLLDHAEGRRTGPTLRHLLSENHGGNCDIFGPRQTRGSWESAQPVGGQMSLTNALPADTCCFANVLVCSPPSVRYRVAAT